MDQNHHLSILQSSTYTQSCSPMSQNRAVLAFFAGTQIKTCGNWSSVACHTETPVCKYRRGRVLDCPLLQMKAWSWERVEPGCMYVLSCCDMTPSVCRVCVCSGLWVTTGQPAGCPAGIRHKTVVSWWVVDLAFTGNACDTSYCSQT